jgi:hypothetical protein
MAYKVLTEDGQEIIATDDLEAAEAVLEIWNHGARTMPGTPLARLIRRDGKSVNRIVGLV